MTLIVVFSEVEAKAQLETIFKEADTDGSGKITLAVRVCFSVALPLHIPDCICRAY